MTEDPGDDTEARAFRGTELPTAVRVEVDSAPRQVAEGRIVEVGVGGVRALLEEGVPEGALCTVRFTDPEMGEHALRGYVRRTCRGDDGYMVGVEFEEPLCSVRATSAAKHLAGLDLSGARILVVDDEAGVVELLYRFLTGLGCEVFTARGGEEALDLIRRETLDFTLLDIRMPGMSGLEVLDTIVEEGLDAGKVWVVSGYANDGEARNALQRGAADFIGKPLDLRYLEWSMRLHRATA